jgi:hypothetical protein
MPTLSPAHIRLEGSLHRSSGKKRPPRRRVRESIEEALQPTRRTTFFATRIIHSPKAASGAASDNLSTAVETRVDIKELPAQRQFLVVWLDAATHCRAQGPLL